MRDRDIEDITEGLISTANGVRFSERALYLARTLPWTTGNDRDMLTRYLWGNEQPEDKEKLQAFALITQERGETQ